MNNFERSLSVIQEQLRSRLRPEFRNIRVQGSNRPGLTNIMFTIFPTNNDQYQMVFTQIKNFRQFRPDGNLDEEMDIINRHIDSFQSSLKNYISY